MAWHLNHYNFPAHNSTLHFLSVTKRVTIFLKYKKTFWKNTLKSWGIFDWIISEAQLQETPTNLKKCLRVYKAIFKNKAIKNFKYYILSEPKGALSLSLGW